MVHIFDKSKNDFIISVGKKLEICYIFFQSNIIILQQVFAQLQMDVQ